jgi:hypothetical protein
MLMHASKNWPNIAHSTNTYQIQLVLHDEIQYKNNYLKSFKNNC